MPQRTIWISDADLARWEAIPNRSQFIKAILNTPGEIAIAGFSFKDGHPIGGSEEKRIDWENSPKLKSNTPKSSDYVEADAIEVCKHGAAVGNCRHGCLK